MTDDPLYSIPLMVCPHCHKNHGTAAADMTSVLICPDTNKKYRMLAENPGDRADVKLLMEKMRISLQEAEKQEAHQRAMQQKYLSQARRRARERHHLRKLKKEQQQQQEQTEATSEVLFTDSSASSSYSDLSDYEQGSQTT